MYSETIVKLLEFMEKSQKTQLQIAKETGILNTVISQFISGTYKGDNEEIANSIEKYLVIATERLENVDNTVFYKDLENTKTSLFAVKYAHKNCEVVLLSGDAGAGKTTALEYYAKNNTGVIFVTASICTSSPTAILKEIALAIGKRATGSKGQIEKMLISVLSNSNRLIIIDEADQLTFNAIQAVRNLNDKAHVGILLSGNNKIYNQMVMGARCTEFDQVRTRIFVDINSGYKFTTYLNYTLKNAFQRVMGLRTTKQRSEPLNNCFSLNSNISQDDEETEEIDFIVDENALKEFERIEVSETQQIVWEAISHLDERSRQVIIMKYFKDMTLRNISDVLSVTIETIRQIELKALRTLRKMPSLRSLYFEMEELETQQRLNYVEYNPECFELIRKIQSNQ